MNPASPLFACSAARALTLAALLAGAAGLRAPAARAQDLLVDSSAVGNSPYNVSSGNLTFDSIRVGLNSQGTLNQSGGTITDNGSLLIGINAGSSGTYNLSGTTSILSTAGQVVVGGTGGGSGTFNQTGGTFTINNNSLVLARGGNGTYTLGGGLLTTNLVAGTPDFQGGGTSTFHFAGGTLRAGASTASFMVNLTTADVQAGGAKIDSNGFNVTVPQTLLHNTASGAPATDGGLTKLGAGTLILTANNTYTGATTISAGTLQVGSGGIAGTLGTSAGTITDNGTLAFNRSDNVLLGNVVTGSGSLTKLGAGTLTLTGNNAYTGGTTFAAGTLNVGSAGALGSTGLLSFNGGTLQFSAANATDYSARFSTAANQSYRIDTNGQNVTFATGLSSDGGSLTKLGNGILSLTGANSYTGGTTFAAGSVAVNNADALGNQGTLSFTGGTLRYSAANQNDYSARFSTAANQAFSINTNGQNVTYATGLRSTGGTLAKLGAGTLTLTGASNYTGNTVVNAGTLALSGGRLDSAPTATLTVDGPTAAAATLSLGGTDSRLTTGAVTVGVAGRGTVNQNGSLNTNGGALILGANANANGAYTLTGGTLTTGPVTVGNHGTGTFNQGGGTFTTNNNFLLLGAEAGASGAYNLTGGSLATGAAFIGFHGSGSVTQGGGTFATANGNTLLLAYDAGISGVYNLNGGTLTTAGVTAGSGASTFNFNGGTLRANAGNTAFLQGLSTVSVQAGGARIDTNGFSVTVAQALVHDPAANAPATDGGLTKLGGNILTLTGASTYAGATTVSAGTLLVNNTAGSGTGSGAVDVLGGATLGGSGTIGGSVTVESGATLAPGNSPGRLTLNANLALAGGSSLRLELGGTTAGSGYDQVAVGGTLSVAGANLNVAVVGGFTLVPGQTFFVLDRTGADVSLTGAFANAPGGLYTDAAGDTFQVNYLAYNPADGDNRLNDVSLTVVAVPEPGAGLLLLLGGTLAGGLRLTAWRRRRQAA